jgi:hypothetical protein
MQSTHQKQSNTRLLIAGALFFTSIIASLIIAYLSSTGDSYWVLKRPLSQGVMIGSADIDTVKITLGRGAIGYLSSPQNPVGLVTRRHLSAGEILNTGDLSANREDLDRESLSIGVRVADIPVATTAGDLVTLYQIFDARNGEDVPEPVRIISGVFIKEISRESANFGSDLGLTISLRREDVPLVLAATSSGRIVVVASRG